MVDGNTIATGLNSLALRKWKSEMWEVFLLHSIQSKTLFIIYYQNLLYNQKYNNVIDQK